MWLSVGRKGRDDITEFHFKASYAHRNYQFSGVGLSISGSGVSVSFSVKSGFTETIHRHLVDSGKKGSTYKWSRASDDR